MAKSNKRPLAIFQTKNFRRIAVFIAKLRNIILDISTNTTIFVTPVPTPASVTTNVDALEDAEAEALTRASGKAAARDQKYEAVLDDVHDWLSYVQSLADNAADEVTAIAIIEASGFSVKVRGVIVRPPLSVKNGSVSGTMLLTARGGGPRTSHEWQSSPNAVTWTNHPSTIKAKTEISGFIKLSTVYFRHRVIRSTGPDPWSQPVNIIVV